LDEKQFHIKRKDIPLFVHNYKILFFVDIIDEKILRELNHSVQHVHYPRIIRSKTIISFQINILLEKLNFESLQEESDMHLIRIVVDWIVMLVSDQKVLLSMEHED
jgi:hypothetical protein